MGFNAKGGYEEIFLIYFSITNRDELMNVLAEKVHEGQIKCEFTD